MTENAELPDIGADEFDVFATPEQIAAAGQLVRYGWSVSHLWEYEQGSLAVWVIAKTPAAKGYSHGYVLPSGELVRYQPPRVRVSKNRDD